MKNKLLLLSSVAAILLLGRFGGGILSFIRNQDAFMIVSCIIYTGYWIFFLLKANGNTVLLVYSVIISVITLFFYAVQLLTIIGNRELEWMLSEGYMPYITPVAAIFVSPLIGYFTIFHSIYIIGIIALIWMSTSIFLLIRFIKNQSSVVPG